MWNVDDKFDSDSVDARNRWGQTRLFRAAEKGDIQLVKKLVADGADISLVDNEKATARIAAWRNGHKKIEEYLSTLEEERGVSPEILAEKARLAFEASEAVKRLQAQKKAALAEKKRQENERKKEEKAIWFYSKDLENREGPMSIITIKKLLKEGGISKDTLVWSPDIDEWKPVEQVVENIQPARTSSLSKQLSAATKKTASEQPAHEAEETLSLERSGPSGIGGWLLFLIVGMVLLGPLLGGGRILVDIMGVEQHYP
ncbi:GYF domain-containing protein, partial [Thiolapillus sp.]